MCRNDHVCLEGYRHACRNVSHRGNVVAREVRIDKRQRRLDGTTSLVFAALFFVAIGLIERGRAAVKVDEALDDAHARARVRV